MKIMLIIIIMIDYKKESIILGTRRSDRRCPETASITSVRFDRIWTARWDCLPCTGQSLCTADLKHVGK